MVIRFQVVGKNVIEFGNAAAENFTYENHRQEPAYSTNVRAYAEFSRTGVLPVFTTGGTRLKRQMFTAASWIRHARVTRKTLRGRSIRETKL